jgi:hypothetical protein
MCLPLEQAKMTHVLPLLSSAIHKSEKGTLVMPPRTTPEGLSAL